VAKAAEHRLFDVRRIEPILLQDIAEREYRLPLELKAEDYQDTGRSAARERSRPSRT
jgi:hypothetical protein